MTGGDCEWKKSIRELEEKKDIKWTFIRKKKDSKWFVQIYREEFLYTLFLSERETPPPPIFMMSQVLFNTNASSMH